VIPHAQGRAPALAARSLPIPVIEAAFGALAMATARAAQAVAAGELGAGRPAVDLAAVAGAADREDRLAAGTAAQPAGRVQGHRRSRDGRRGSPSESAENVRQSEAGERLPYTNLGSST
jgi:hypothetical protein